MTRTPFIYTHPLVYQGLMRFLYGRHFQARYVAIAAEVPAKSSIIEVCAGDCYLYERYLRHKEVAYCALDASAQFVANARARGIEARSFDLAQDDVPYADVVIIQASLCHFLPRAGAVLEKLRRAARTKLIVAEPVRNLSTSNIPVVAALSRLLTRAPERFDSQSLPRLFSSIEGFERSFLIPGGREMVGVFRGLAG